MQSEPGPPRTVANYMIWSIVCVLLFWPLAIPAIVNASRRNSLVAAGDYPGAQEASRKSRTWAICATVLGVILWPSFCVFGIAAAVAPTQVASLLSHLVGHG